MAKHLVSRKNHKESLGIVIVSFFAFLAARHLFIPGFLPTHDGEYHLIRFYEFGKMLAGGHLFPRWAPGLNSGYGVPLFNFFYPLPNYVGSFFHFFGWSLADAFRLTLALGYILAVSASYVWLKRLYGVFPAVLGSIVGAFTPYWFVDIFVRGSVGEVLSLGFVFVALASIAYRKKTLLALAIAAMSISHNIIAMIFLPILFLSLWITDRSMLRSIIVGIILTSYFWAPALIEKEYVVGLNTVNYKDHFPELAQLLIPSWGTGLSGSSYALDEMSFQIGIIPLALFIISLVVLPRTIFAGAMAIAFFLMLEFSVPVWEWVPFLKNIQYPWRLLSVVIVATPFLSAAIFSRFRRRVISFAVTAIAVVLSFSYTKPVLYAPRSDAYYLSRREFTDGTSSLGNGFSTVWMAWQSQRPRSRTEIISGEGSITTKQDGSTTFESEVVSTSDVTVRTNVAYYPGWRVVMDGKSLAAMPDTRGAISIAIPQGKHDVKVYFGETPIRFAANLVSLICLFWLFYSTILKKRYAYRH